MTVPVDLYAPDVERILVEYHEAHEKAFTFRLDDTPVEFVTYRLSAHARVPKLELKPITPDGRSVDAACKGIRNVDFAEDGRHETSIYERSRLPPGASLAGPLIVEEATSTTVVHPGQSLRVDDFGFLRISNS